MSDDPDDWVFDEDFVRGGRYEPPARTRAAINELGGRRTSWRQPGDPEGHDPRRHGGGRARRRRGGRPGRGGAGGGRGRNSSMFRSQGPRNWLVAVVLTVGVVALGFWVYATRDQGRTVPRAAPPTVGRSSVATPAPSETADTIEGMSPAMRPGTCLTDSSAPAHRPATPQHLHFATVACSAPHTEELMAIRQALDTSDFPDDSYWQGSILPACRSVFVGFTGSHASAVAHRVPNYIRPTPQSWAENHDRIVYCVAESDSPLRGSVRVATH